MDKFKKINEEVYYTKDGITWVGNKEIKWLKQNAIQNVRKRARICAHHDPDDALHEMIIALTEDIYVVPHKHRHKTESFHIIEGVQKVILFDDDGEVVNYFVMGGDSPDRISYLRIPSETYHTVLPLSPVVVFHETTNGPFLPQKTIYASWAVKEDDVSSIEATKKHWRNI